MKNPTQCHLWQTESLTSRELQESLVLIEEFTDESHHGQYLRQCKLCGQLYLHEFLEWIDWVDGDDPQLQTYLPVDSIADVEKLLNSDGFRLESHSPRLVSDFPKDAQSPRIYWVR